MTDQPTRKKPSKETRFSMMIVGVIIGSVIGWLMFDSLAIGIAFGLPIGIVFGMAFASTSTEHEGIKKEKLSKK